LALGWLLPITLAIFPPPYHGEQLPKFTKWCLALSPWLKYLGFIGFVYPASVVFRKNAQTDEILVYLGIVFLIVALLFFTLAFTAIIPWITTTGAHSP
jgi:hypothetical protein